MSELGIERYWQKREKNTHTDNNFKNDREMLNIGRSTLDQNGILQIIALMIIQFKQCKKSAYTNSHDF